MARWNPWHGCSKISEGCRHCYVYRIDGRYSRDSSVVYRTRDFDLPVRRCRDGRYKIPSGETVYTCFSSDFLLDAADEWRGEAWAMMRLRSDLHFFMITKRIDRLMSVVPDDWRTGYSNVTLCCTVENQERADYRLPLYSKAPIARKIIVCEPLLGSICLHICRSLFQKWLSGASRDPKLVLVVTNGCLICGDSVSKQELLFHSNRRGQTLSRKGVYIGYPARCSMRRPVKPTLIFARTEKVFL